MAFATKIDRCGLLAAVNPASPAAAKIVIRDSNRNGSIQKYQPQGTCGDFIATEIYGADSAPSCSYGLCSDLTLAVGDIKLGKVTSVTESGDQTSTKYGLSSVNIQTGAASPVTIAATSQQLESAATDGWVYNVPALTLSKRQCAQVLFDAFTLTGNGCKLTQCSANIQCAVNTDKVAGDAISSDINSGIITISGSILRVNTGTDADPVITAKAEAVSLGNNNTATWVLTKPPTPTETNGETSFKVYSFELELCLVRSDESETSNS